MKRLWLAGLCLSGLMSSFVAQGCGTDTDDCEVTLTCACSSDQQCSKQLGDLEPCRVAACGADADGICGVVNAPAGAACPGGQCDEGGICMPGSSSGGGGTGGGEAPPGCGDGTINGSEECDDGMQNGPGQQCLTDCVLNECGDGDRGPGEACDDGVANGAALGLCAPDCSRYVEQKRIQLSATAAPSGDFSPNPVAYADGFCPVGYKAMFAFGTDRRATTMPFQTVAPIDWPVRPYTYYFNVLDEPVFLTHETALLGIRNGDWVGLEHAVTLALAAAANGLTVDGTTIQGENCFGWTSTSTVEFKNGAPFRVDEAFIEDGDTLVARCNADGTPPGFYFVCIEQ